MIIESKQFHSPLAIGLRWLVATHSEIEYLKDRSDLQHGFVLPTPERATRKYKIAALASAEHDKSFSLAALLAQKFENLIFVHKLSNDFYWLCVIKNHRVWNEVDIGEQTAGDLLGNREKISAAVLMARDDFSEAGIDMQGSLFGSNLSDGEFTALTPSKFNEVIAGIRKNNKFKIKLLENYRKKMRQIAMMIALVVISSVVVYYIYQTQNEAARTRALQAQQALAAQQAMQARINYFNQMDRKLDTQQGSKVIARFLSLLETLPLQSQGWQVSDMNYQANIPQLMKLQLVRGDYGDVLTFNQAFSSLAVAQAINSDNNSGNKTLQFKLAPITSQLTAAEETNYQKLLMEKQPTQRLALIAYTQRHAMQITIQALTTEQYQIQSSHFSLTGNQLWNLRKLQYIFKQFPTLVVDSIDVKVDADRKIAWQVEGDIYG